MRIVRGGLSWVAVTMGLLAASLSVIMWLGAAVLDHNRDVLDDVSGALSPSTLLSSGLHGQLTPAQQARASGALSTALADPTVHGAIAKGQGDADGALEAELRTIDPALAGQLAAHPPSIATLRKTVSGLPRRLETYSDWAAAAALGLVGVGFLAGAKRQRVVRRSAEWALTTGGLGLALGMVVPYVASRILRHGPVARFAHGLADGTSASAGALFIALVVAGVAGMVVGALWSRSQAHAPTRVPQTVSW